MKRTCSIERFVDRGHLAQDRLEEGRDLRDERARRLEPAERVEHRPGLDQRVVGRVRIRGVPAPAPEPDPERRRRLLPDRAEVEHAVAEDAPLAAALVEPDVRAHEVRVPRREPRRAEIDPDLLVRGQR